jgi:NADPH:quinone reductase-like Zn-dependent oxidoreductase
MQVLSYEAFGDPAEVLRVLEVTPRPPGPGEVRVDVRSAPIHNADLLQVRGLYGRSSPTPATPGSEGVGYVAQLGEGVTHLHVGETVFISGGATWAQQVTVPAAQLIALPPGDLDQLAMLVSSPATAHLLLSQFVDLNEGDWLVQSAANSAVGSALVQLAKARGVRTVNLVRRQEVVDELYALGADVVLVGTHDLQVRIAEATGGASIQLAVDAVGGPVFTLFTDVLSSGGTLVTYSQAEPGASAITPADLIFKQLKVAGFWLSQWFSQASTQDKQALFAELIPRVTSGQLTLAVDSTHTLDQVAEAVTRSMAGRRNGKVMFHPNG